MHPNHVFVEHSTSKAAMCVSDVIFLYVLRTSMCCGTRLTAVAVGLSVVVLDDKEVKMPASMACSSHSKDCYCCELPEAILYQSDNAYIDRRKSGHT